MTKAARDIVVFDLGGVLIDWDPRHLYRKLFAGDEAAQAPDCGASSVRGEAVNGNHSACPAPTPPP